MTTDGPALGRKVAARALTILGVVLAIVTMLAGYLRWQAFDQETFETTAEQLIADDAIRERVAARTTEALLENVDVEQEIAAKLPEAQQGLAAPLAATIEASAQRVTEELLARPKLQDLWVFTAGQTQKRVERILDDDVRGLETVDGKIVLDLRPLVSAVGEEIPLLGKAAGLVPEERAVIEIAEAEQLETAQDVTALFKAVAPWIGIAMILCFVAAIWLARGGRRIEIRAVGIGLVVAGFIVLVVRSLAGAYLVDDLVPREEGKEAGRNAWDILTQLLADGAWSAILLGLTILFGAIVAGPTSAGRAARKALAPAFESRWVLYGGLAAFLLLLAWWNPIAQTGRLGYMIAYAVLLVVGAEALRALVRRDSADAPPVPPPAPPPPPPAAPPPAAV